MAGGLGETPGYDSKELDKLNKGPEQEKNDQNGKTIEEIKNKGNDIADQAKKTSPEANEGGGIDLCKSKFDHTTSQIQERFKRGDISEEQRTKEMNEATKEFTNDVAAVVGTMEGSQSKQNKRFLEDLANSNKEYNQKLSEFAQKLKDINMINKMQKEANGRIDQVAKNDAKIKEERRNDPTIKTINSSGEKGEI